MTYTDTSTLTESSRPSRNSRLLTYAGLDLLGMLVLVAGAIPLLDGMPLFDFPATTDEAIACVIAGLALCVFAAAKLIQEVFRQARRDASAN